MSTSWDFGKSDPKFLHKSTNKQFIIKNNLNANMLLTN